MSNSRLEKFIYAICGMEVDDLPAPLSRIETLWNCLITGETPDFEPLSRNEKYLMSMIGQYDILNLPEPASRSEKLLYKIATGETDLSDVPGYLSRYEELLKHLIESGGIGGTDFEYVLYTLNDSFSTLYSTAEVPVKSAILKGQTLVNLFKQEDDKIISDYQSGNIVFTDNQKVELKASTKYTFIFKASGVVSAIGTAMYQYQGYNIDGVFYKYNVGRHTMINGLNYLVFTPPVDIKSISFLSYATFSTGGGCTIHGDSFILLEGDYTNVDIPYFEGMQSVKMPVLRTVGKNLFDGVIKENNYVKLVEYDSKQCVAITARNDLDGLFEFTKPIPCTKGLTLSFMIQSAGYCKIRPVFEDDTFGNEIGSWFGFPEWTKTFYTIPQSSKRLRGFVTGSSGNTAVSYLESNTIQIEQGSTVTAYEPYKSNILSCNEEVTLRGIGEVKDTLDGNTGELTQRIGEVVLDGSEDEGWEKHSTTNTFYSAENTVLNNLTRVLCVCDKMIAKQVPSNTWLSFGEVGVFYTKVGIGFNGTLEELIIHLQQNPITLQYELEEPVIKTVDLSITDQDGQPMKLSTFNDITHVSIEAEDLLPTVDLEVATKIEETLSSLPTQMIDISETQQSLNEKIDEQAKNIKEVSTAMIEIRNDIL